MVPLVFRISRASDCLRMPPRYADLFDSLYSCVEMGSVPANTLSLSPRLARILSGSCLHKWCMVREYFHTSQKFSFASQNLTPKLGKEPFHLKHGQNDSK